MHQRAQEQVYYQPQGMVAGGLSTPYYVHGGNTNLDHYYTSMPPMHTVRGGAAPPPSHPLDHYPHPHPHQPHHVVGPGVVKRRRFGSWWEEWVDELTRALPMRAAFYHHVAFAVLTSQLPRLHWDMCDPVPAGLGWACMGVCTLMAVIHSIFAERNVLWAIFSLLFYAGLAYASTPQFFSCYDEIYDPTVSRYLVMVLLAVLTILKVLVGLWKLRVQRSNKAELKNLNTLEDDLDVFKTDI